MDVFLDEHANYHLELCWDVQIKKLFDFLADFPPLLVIYCVDELVLVMKLSSVYLSQLKKSRVAHNSHNWVPDHD